MAGVPEPILSSTPSFSEFYPAIPYQQDVIDAIDHELDFSLGVHEILLSGSVGSAKSILMAHCALKHLLTYDGARGIIGRQSMPDLRDTIFTKILEHLEGSVNCDGTLFKEGIDFGFSEYNCRIWFRNKSEFVSRSWHDKKFKKLGSLEASIAIIEELTENDLPHWPAIQFIRMRVGRLSHVPVSWIMYATNPDSPSHPAYDYFQIGLRQNGRTQGLKPQRHVYFSKTVDNPFLPPWYIEQLRTDLDPKMVLRMVEGHWVEIKTGVIYHAYSSRNFKETAYEVIQAAPIYLNFDFNIGHGKPMSACFSQVRPNGPEFHFFGEAVVEGADTHDLMEEIAGLGILENHCDFYVHGDATGASRSTKSKKTDYDIIREFLTAYRRKDGSRLNCTIDVPKSNPPIRSRHNLVNGYCQNSLNKIRVLVYRDCKMLDKGMRLVAPKKGGTYAEDDSFDYQHMTTAAGYHICRIHDQIRSTTGSREVRIR